MEPPDFEKIAAQIELLDSCGRIDRRQIVGALQAAFDMGHQRGRADAIESAARVADREAGDWRIDDRENWAQGFQDGCMECAAAIRARQSQEEDHP